MTQNPTTLLQLACVINKRIFSTKLRDNNPALTHSQVGERITLSRYQTSISLNLCCSSKQLCECEQAQTDYKHTTDYISLCPSTFKL